MKAEDVTGTLTVALKASGCDDAKVVHKPRMLSDNGSSYISGDLADWLEDKGMNHVRGAPHHPQTQGKIERWHQTQKNRVLLENYYLAGDLEHQVGTFIDTYNHHRVHESLGNVTPADAYFGRQAAILERHRKIKEITIRMRRLNHHGQAAQHQQTGTRILRSDPATAVPHHSTTDINGGAGYAGIVGAIENAHDVANAGASD